jgi:GNAT superfamily N-acetyltransferase
MQQSRILTPDDEVLVPSYIDILNRGLDSVNSLYKGTTLQDAREKYTENFMVRHLPPNLKNRFIGHFTEDTLDGILIEGLGEKCTTLNWVVANQQGKGIGTLLIEDFISRAKKEKKETIQLAVSINNGDAKKLYEKLGFVSGKDQNYKFL